MRQSGGHVALHRKVRDSEIWKTLAGRSVWTELLLKTAHTPFSFLHQTSGTQIEIARGQCVIGVRPFADECLVSYTSARNMLEKMQKLEMVKLEIIGKGANRLTVVTMLNFEKYNAAQKMEAEEFFKNGLGPIKSQTL